MMNKIIFVILLLSLISCSPVITKEKLVYVTVPLSVPVAPILPTWSSSDMSCLSIDIQKKMLERDKLRKEYIVELKAVIESTK